MIFQLTWHDRFVQRLRELTSFVLGQGHPHVISVFGGSGVRRIVACDTTVYLISKLPVEVDRDIVRRPHEQVDEVRVMPLDRYFVQVLHQRASQPLPPELRRDCDRTHVTVPVSDHVISFVALDFANEIALDRRHCVFADDTVLAPLVEILAVEVSVEGLGQEV